MTAEGEQKPERSDKLVEVTIQDTRNNNQTSRITVKARFTRGIKEKRTSIC